MTYAERKNAAREKAMRYQNTIIEFNLSWGEMAELQAMFERLGKRYGLLQEFKENGII